MSEPLWTGPHNADNAKIEPINHLAKLSSEKLTWWTAEEMFALRQVLDEKDKRIAELEAALAAATRYVPVEDGEYVHDSIIDGRVVMKIDDDGETIQTWDTDGYGPESIHLQPFSFRLCRLTDEPPPLDMPDGPGLWAWEGYINYDDGDVDANNMQREVCRVERGNSGKLWVYIFGGPVHRAEIMIGKWYRLTMPWEGR